MKARSTVRPKVTIKTLRASPPARKLATAVLEVLGGVITTTQAAHAAGISLQRYYALEARALAGLIAALEPVPKGRRRSAEAELAVMQKDNGRLQREVGRLSALVRAAHRAMGLAEAKQDSKSAGRRKRKPSARAVKAVAVLRQAGLSGDDEPDSSAPQEA